MGGSPELPEKILLSNETRVRHLFGIRNILGLRAQLCWYNSPPRNLESYSYHTLLKICTKSVLSSCQDGCKCIQRIRRTLPVYHVFMPVGVYVSMRLVRSTDFNWYSTDRWMMRG